MAESNVSGSERGGQGQNSPLVSGGALHTIRNLAQRLFFIIVIAIFLGEALIMLLLGSFPPLDPVAAMLVDATLLVTISLPVLYLFFYKPFTTTISKKEAAELELDLSTAIIDQTADAIIITDTDGRIEFVNPAFESSTGYSSEEVIGQNPRLLKSDRHPPSFFERMWDTLLRGEVWRGRLVNRGKDGSFIEVDSTIAPIHDKQGNIRKYFSVHHDVTAQLNLERQVRQRHKMEAIGSLAGGIAHDFNNILSAIIGYIEMSRECVERESEVHEDLGEALKASYRAKDLVRQILTFSRQTESELKPLKLEIIVNESLKLMRATLSPSVEIITDIDPLSGSALADPTQISQVVMNLCANAAHAMKKDGGALRVGLRQVKLDQPLTAINQVLEPDHYILLTIADEGYGIDAVTLDRIFDPFFTTKEVGEGTGLGLAAVHGIVTSHGGAITVESEVGVGSCFSVYFPVAEGVGSAPTASVDSVDGGGDERIMLVDDEKALAEMFQRGLEKQGYQVTPFTSPEEAVAAFAQKPDSWDMVITDLAMPRMNGVALMEKILARQPNIPFVLLTGFGQEDMLARARKMGVTKQLLKPLSISSLAGAVREVIDAKNAAASGGKG